jgi:hypothetical protein
LDNFFLNKAKALPIPLIKKKRIAQLINGNRAKMVEPTQTPTQIGPHPKHHSKNERPPTKAK